MYNRFMYTLQDGLYTLNATIDGLERRLATMPEVAVAFSTHGEEMHLVMHGVPAEVQALAKREGFWYATLPKLPAEELNAALRDNEKLLLLLGNAKKL